MCRRKAAHEERESERGHGESGPEWGERDRLYPKGHDRKSTADTRMLMATALAGRLGMDVALGRAGFRGMGGVYLRGAAGSKRGSGEIGGRSKPG